MKQLMETKIPDIYSNGLDEKAISVPAAVTDKIATVLFEAVSRCLGDIKTKEYPTMFLFENLKGDAIASAVVEYHETEDSKEAGNWSYTWEFGKINVPDNARIIKIADQCAHTYFNSVAGKRFRMAYEAPSYIIELNNFFLEVLSKYLDDNASKDKEVEVELTGVFQSRAVVEGKSIVKSLEPCGEMKAIVKGDAAIAV